MKGANEYPFARPHRFEMVPFEEAFSREWEIDAHFVTYDVPSFEDFPRLNKSSRVLQDLIDDGHEVVTTMFALDYDNPEHVAWTPEMLVEFEGRSRHAAQAEPLIGGWHAYYTTKHGARFVYVLKEPLPVGEETEALHRDLVRTWGQHGIVLDPCCSDWTRFFRLPKVTRE